MKGSTHNYIPVRTTKAYREAQSDEKFQGWLKMQEAAVDIEFIIEDLPEVRDVMYSKESLHIVEARLLELYPDESAAYNGDENIHRTMRQVYYIGDTFRRAFEGTWVALPKDKPKSTPAASRPAVDLPFTEDFIIPSDFLGRALYHRSGTEISFVYGRMQKRHNQWLDDGRPERLIAGTLREKNATQGIPLNHNH